MDDLKKIINENLNKNYELFSKNYEKFFDSLAASNLDEICSNVDAELNKDSEIMLDFFNNIVLLSIKEKKVFILPQNNKKASPKALDIFASSIILHYLLNADGAPVAGQWILYRDLPGGLFYDATIGGVLKPLVDKFKASGNAFIEKIQSLGGARASFGQYAGIIYPFKKFPVLFILEQKDEEFDASIRALFDISAPHYIKTDIIKTLLVYTVKKLLT
ncbi:MAG: DUF3786 domain-containing protein [Actinobacteria bacterium]|nr:DUF3786 domain-containing protein [Actinomycetota bacterium]